MPEFFSEKRIGGDVPAKQSIGVAVQVQIMSESVDRLWHVLHQMTDTLEPLLAPPSPVEAMMTDRQKAPHELGEKVAQLADRIDDAAGLIDQLRNRLY